MARLNVPISNQKALAEPVNMAVFAFNSKGQFLEVGSVNAKGVAELKSLDKYTDVQLYIIPEPDKSVSLLRTIAALQRYRPYQPKLTRIKDGFQILPVPEHLLHQWQFRICRVTGVVSKNFSIDDQNIRLPLCKARVHICEIDKIIWWIPRLPDDIIMRIPDIIKKPPVIIRHPWPPLPPDPYLFERINLSSTVKRDVLPNLASIKLNRLDPKFTIVNSLPKLDVSSQKALESRNPAMIRNALIKNIELLHPYFCYAPWIWPYLYKSDEIRTVYTDNNGRYEADIIYLAKGDKPDIYVWIEYLIDGQWETVYRPSIPCNTHWDYHCGTDINVNITDPRVRPGCSNELQADAIWIRAIGNYSVRSVSQSAVGPDIQGVPFNRLGLFRTAGDFRSPLSTTESSSHMQMVVKFGSLVPNNTATYFRWVCRKITDGNMQADLSDVRYLNDPIVRRYYFEYKEDPSDPNSATHFSTGGVSLGPVSKSGMNNLFLIPPTSPVGFQGVTEPTAEWVDADTVTTNLDTNALMGDGLYRFWIEIFDKDGNKVNKPNTFFQIPEIADASESETATPPYLGNIEGFNAFQMFVRIDNNNCQAAIYPVELTNPARVADACGFIQYTNVQEKNVSISFKAFHPFNFANFNFTVVRGNVGTGGAGTPASASGMVIGDVDRYNRDSLGNYKPSNTPVDDEFSPAELLGPCTAAQRAAFAQSLYVSALHTDGYRRLNERDRSSLAAFALEG